MSTFLTADRESDIKKAFHMISNSTCIQFKPRQKELTYLKLKKGKWFGELCVCLFASPCPHFIRPVFFIHQFEIGLIVTGPCLKFTVILSVLSSTLPRTVCFQPGRPGVKATETRALSPPGAHPMSAVAGGRSCSLSQTLAKWATSATRSSTHWGCITSTLARTAIATSSLIGTTSSEVLFFFFFFSMSPSIPDVFWRTSFVVCLSMSGKNTCL